MNEHCIALDPRIFTDSDLRVLIGVLRAAEPQPFARDALAWLNSEFARRSLVDPERFEPQAMLPLTCRNWSDSELAHGLLACQALFLEPSDLVNPRCRRFWREMALHITKFVASRLWRMQRDKEDQSNDIGSTQDAGRTADTGSGMPLPRPEA